MSSNNLENLIRKVIIGSTAISTALYSNTQNSNTEPNHSSEGDNDKNITFKEKDVSKLVFRSVEDTGDFLLVSHRSHRSHSSHRSHYSSRTTPRNTPVYTPPAPVKKPTIKSEKIGDRVLKQGMFGNDVLELKSILYKMGYKKIDLDDKWFTTTLKIAVKDYQAKNELPVDGIVGPMTVYYLKNY